MSVMFFLHIGGQGDYSGKVSLAEAKSTFLQINEFLLMVQLQENHLLVMIPETLSSSLNHWLTPAWPLPWVLWEFPNV